MRSSSGRPTTPPSSSAIGGAQATLGALASERFFRPYGAAASGPRFLGREAVRQLREGGYTCVLGTACRATGRTRADGLSRALADVRGTTGRSSSCTTSDGRDGGALRFLERLRDDGVTIVPELPPAHADRARRGRGAARRLRRLEADSEAARGRVELRAYLVCRASFAGRGTWCASTNATPAAYPDET
jgi:hypothetical protein